MLISAKNINFEFRVIFWLELLMLLFSFELNAAPEKTTGIETELSDVKNIYFKTVNLDANLAILLHAMGKSPPPTLGVVVLAADKRQVYYESLSLFRKVNRLSFELLRIKRQEPELSGANLVWSDINYLIEHAESLIDAIFKKFDIAKAKQSQLEHKQSFSPQLLLASLLNTNRFINHVLERPFSPSDVYQELTVAVGYAANLLSRHPNVSRIPDSPEFEKNKKPVDVFMRLYSILDDIDAIAKTENLQMVKLDISQIKTENILPGDVYDMAQLVVSELVFLHDYYNSQRIIPPRFYPGAKFPAHVYQRAGLLQKQIESLRKQMN